MSPLDKNTNTTKNKDLANSKTQVDRKTDSRNSENVPNQAQELPPDLAEIVAIWPDLPEHIKAAIKAMIQSHEGKA